MKSYLPVWLTIELLGFATQAQESSYAPRAAAPSAEVLKIASASADDEAYAALLKGELEFQTQNKLLSDLAQEHRRRAEEASKANQSEKTLWETELAKELSDKGSVALKQLDELTKRRLAFEQIHTNASPSVASLYTASAGSRLGSYEVEFLSRLEDRLESVSQELSAARQDATLYAVQLHTNTMPYDLATATSLIEQNARHIRELQQQQFDLELRKLEFQALRRH